jgi:hypothetical protein
MEIDNWIEPAATALVVGSQVIFQHTIKCR